MPGKDGTGPDGNGPKQENPGTPRRQGPPGSQVPRGRGKGRGRGKRNRGQFCPWRDPRDEEAPAGDADES